MPQPAAYGVLEELGAEIGYTATNLLVDWFGGGNLWVPQEAKEDHPISQVIGLPAMRSLVRFIDRKAVNKLVDRQLWLPLGYQREINRRDRMIAAMIANGTSIKEIVAITGMSQSHVYEVRLRVERLGILPMILRKRGLAGDDPPEESAQQKPPTKPARQNRP